MDLEASRRNSDMYSLIRTLTWPAQSWLSGEQEEKLLQSTISESTFYVEMSESEKPNITSITQVAIVYIDCHSMRTHLESIVKFLPSIM